MSLCLKLTIVKVSKVSFVLRSIDVIFPDFLLRMTLIRARSLKKIFSCCRWKFRYVRF